VKNITFQKLEKGQILPILVVGLIIIISMTALILDGGSVMVNRRRAQNAADAGALAGARDLCLNKSETIAEATAIDYATNKNNATSATADANISERVITVTAEIQQNSFFARIFNQTQLNSSAIASAACFPPSGSYVMPIAWSCHNPIIGGPPVSDSPDCMYQNLDWNTVINPLRTSDPSFFTKNTNTPLPEIYIIMDSDKVCGVDIICDFNGDGIDEVASGGNRGWLNLTGVNGCGTSELRNWINNGLNQKLYIHTWLTACGGEKNAVFSTIDDKYVQNISDQPVVFIPVFNYFCDHLPVGSDSCIESAHATATIRPGDTDSPLVTENTDAYHIIGFSPFFISCVGDKCPGYKKFTELNTDKGTWPKNSVEGYFVSGYPFPAGDVGTGGVDLGVYIVSLTK